MFQLYYPVSEKLKKIIKHIFSYHCETGCNKKYIIFPNLGSALTIYKDVHYSKSDNIYISKESVRTSNAIVHVQRVDPIEVVDIGKQNRITIVFEELGINHFIVGKNLKDCMSGYDPTLIPAETIFPDIAQLLKTVNADIIIDEKLKNIECFLLDHLSEFEDARMIDALSIIKNEEKPVSLFTLSKRLYVSPRNLRRFFKNHLLLSPVEYRKVSQFRNALNQGLGDSSKKIKDLASDADYYDPSYMIKMYKKYTGTSPGKLFRDLEVQVNGKFMYRLL